MHMSIANPINMPIIAAHMPAIPVPPSTNNETHIARFRRGNTSSYGIHAKHP